MTALRDLSTEDARRILDSAPVGSFLGPDEPGTIHCPRCATIMPGSVCGKCGWKATVDKPAAIRKWFPTGNLAWREVPNSKVVVERPSLISPDSRRWQLVQELFEAESCSTEWGSDTGFNATGRFEWRPIPILSPDPPLPHRLIPGTLPLFDSPLLNQTPSPAS